LIAAKFAKSPGYFWEDQGMTARVILVDGVDYAAQNDVPIKVLPAGLATINNAHKRGALAVIEIGGTTIVEFVPKTPLLKLVPVVA
jgi:hypothetical protein